MEQERLARTRQLLMDEKSVRVDELAELFGVTSMTIRRDLDKLVNENPQIHRCRGGAVLVTDIHTEETYPAKLVLNLEEKQAIARRAYMLLRPGQLLYLDAGTTCFEVARLLAQQPINLDVVTNDLHTASFLTECGYHVLVIGGRVEKNTGCLIGDMAENSIRGFCFDLAFLGATAVNENFEVLTPTPEKVTLKKLILSRATRTYLLTDHTKFFHHAHYVIYTLEDFDGVFTTQSFVEKNEIMLRERNIQML